MTDTKIASPVFAVRLPPLALDVLGKVSDATQTLWGGEVYMVQIGQYLVITTEAKSATATSAHAAWARLSQPQIRLLTSRPGSITTP